MIEIIKDILVDFILFSGIEGFIFCLFFTKVGDCKKINFIQWFVLSFVNCIISKFLPPVIYQLTIILWISVFLYMLNGKDKYFRYLIIGLSSVGLFFVEEILYSIILQKFLSLELLKFFMNDLESLKLFIFIIPLRIIEIINIFIIRRVKMKIVLGGVVRK